jgi:ubiquinone biosynthesis UbiH/UbiF/VisC/COQ6 family hydroxylase
MPISCDVAIVGGGPAGLALACALADQGQKVVVAERQPEAALAQPVEDGREIALTQRSMEILEALGIARHLPHALRSPIAAARVINGNGPGQAAQLLEFVPGQGPASALGCLIPNQEIRRAAYRAVSQRSQVQLLCARAAVGVEKDAQGAQLRLDDGETVDAALLVAADSRLSTFRGQLGIAAQMRDFGRTVIVCRLGHSGSADGVAYECFGHERTLAILPLTQQRVSAVITVPNEAAAALLECSAQSFVARVQAQFGPALGQFELLGARHAYPLLSVYARHFVSERAALIGDAAVGMHPVTAHGFNLGLYGVEALSTALLAARRGGRDIGSLDALRLYERELRRESLPMYLGTNALVSLYTDERLPARVARRSVLAFAQHCAPLKRVITRRLTERRPPRSLGALRPSEQGS